MNVYISDKKDICVSILNNEYHKNTLNTYNNFYN